MNEDGEFEDYQDEGFYMDFSDDDPSDLGFDPYAGTYVDDEPISPYDYEDEYYGPEYD